MVTVSLLDYGAGNVRSVRNALSKLGYRVVDIDKPEQLRSAQVVVFPGVGSFGAAMSFLEQKGFLEPLREHVRADRPFVGICLGMQTLFEGSEESPGVHGLGVLPGVVRRFQIPDSAHPLAVPQIGWNGFAPYKQSPALAGLDEDSCVYYVHSYYVPMADELHDWILTTTTCAPARLAPPPRRCRPPFTSPAPRGLRFPPCPPSARARTGTAWTTSPPCSAATCSPRSSTRKSHPRQALPSWTITCVPLRRGPPCRARRPRSSLFARARRRARASASSLASTCGQTTTATSLSPRATRARTRARRARARAHHTQLLLADQRARARTRSANRPYERTVLSHRRAGRRYNVREVSAAAAASAPPGGKGAVRNLGKPVALASRYYEEGADEITFLNITGFRDSPLGDLPMLSLLVEASQTLFVPLAVGGGIRDYVDAQGVAHSALDVAAAYFRAGADKVSIGSEVRRRCRARCRPAGRCGATSRLTRIPPSPGRATPPPPPPLTPPPLPRLTRRSTLRPTALASTGGRCCQGLLGARRLWRRLELHRADRARVRPASCRHLGRSTSRLGRRARRRRRAQRRVRGKPAGRARPGGRALLLVRMHSEGRARGVGSGRRAAGARL